MEIIIYLVPLLVSISAHEAAHGLAADIFGDDTARRAGRITLNPIKHLDPVGSFLLPAILYFTSAGFIFGYAKPVPVRFDRLSPPRSGMIAVSLAGVGANLVLAGLFGLLFRLIRYLITAWQWPAFLGIVLSSGLKLSLIFVVINVILAVFNLIPIPPLDGWRFVSALIPARVRHTIEGVEALGMVLLLVVIFSTKFLDFLDNLIITPMIHFFIN